MIDTNVAIDLLKQPMLLLSRFRSGVQLYLPVVVLGELYHGSYSSTDAGKSITTVEAFAASMKVVEVSVQIARRFGSIRAHLWKAGSPIPDDDVWIAAAASVLVVPLVTRDKHFANVPDLDVIDW